MIQTIRGYKQISVKHPFAIVLESTKTRTVLIHVAAWLVVFSLPYLLRFAYEESWLKNPESKGFFYLSLFTGLLWVATFYLNAYLFFPKLLHTKKYASYVGVVLVLFIVIMGIHGFFFRNLIQSMPFRLGISAIFNLPAYLLSLATSTIYQLWKDRTAQAKLTRQKQEENLKTELSFLRSQISPHFIFNVLNNIVALARLKSDQLEPTVIKLSSLMQYMLYETNEERVLLKTETEYLKSYIDLQQQRFGGKVKVNVTIDSPDDFYEIEPMLLIPFVENAFKHGVGLIENPEINIHLKTKDNQLSFFVQNKFNNHTEEAKDKASGIGLNNVERRLNLLYKDQHTLTINRQRSSQGAQWFEVYLLLKLH
ncbi:MAG: histidine kinase [Bacteroidota bacterium]